MQANTPSLPCTLDNERSAVREVCGWGKRWLWNLRIYKLCRDGLCKLTIRRERRLVSDDLLRAYEGWLEEVWQWGASVGPADGKRVNGTRGYSE